MQDFDLIGAENREHADRTFRIGGQEFTFRSYMHPSILIELENAKSDEDWLKKADKFMVENILEPGQEKAWAAVRDIKAERAISVYEMASIIQHAVSVTSGRPTQPSSDSSPTPSRPGMSSTEKSPAAVAT